MKIDCTIYKVSPSGEVKWQYQGKILALHENHLCLEAFAQNANDAGYMTLEAGDRFFEHYYNDRYYNIYAIYQQKSSSLKGWYCNIGMPAQFSNGAVSYVDLALDLWVYPNGEYLLLDEDEFEMLDLPAVTQQKCWQAIDTLIQLAKEQSLPTICRQSLP